MADKSKPAPASLFVHLAREAPVGVILRRGPTAWVQIILWHTDNDTFEFGQWFHGRIYERACDVSPDGSLFLYGAAHQYHYFLLDHTVDAEISLANVTWTDFDQRGRLVFARDGKLFAIGPNDPQDNAQEIAAFNDQRFTPIIAPDWAQRW